MATGAYDAFRGDTWAIVSTLQAPALAAGFAAVGGLWTLLAGVLISFDVIRLLGGPGRDLRHESLMLILFWLVPAPLAFLPGFSAFNALGESPVLYVGAFAAVITTVAALLLYLDFLPYAREQEPRTALRWKSVAAVALPLLLFVPAWVGVFGVTQQSATGLLLETPPVQVEPAWLGDLGMNLEVFVHYDFNVTLFWRVRGTVLSGSPLAEQIAASFLDRMEPDF